MKYTIMSRMRLDDGRDNWTEWDEDPYMQPQEGSPADILNGYLSAVEDNLRCFDAECVECSDVEATYRYKAYDGKYALLEIRVFEVEEA